MVSGNSVPRPALALFRPELSPVLRAAFGNQPVSHLLLGSTADPRFARLVIDSQLLQALLSGTTSEGSDEIARRLSQFNTQAVSAVVVSCVDLGYNVQAAEEFLRANWASGDSTMAVLQLERVMKSTIHLFDEIQELLTEETL
jgi:hypothetical protein